jgi:hypothetical protein
MLYSASTVLLFALDCEQDELLLKGRLIVTFCNTAEEMLMGAI